MRYIKKQTVFLILGGDILSNYDKLQSLSIMELAEFFDQAIYCCNNQNCLDCTKDKKCSNCAYQWLIGKHNGSNICEYDKIHSMSVKKFAKEYANVLCLVIPCKRSAPDLNCIVAPYKCVLEWLQKEESE